MEELNKYIEEKNYQKVAKWLQENIEDLYFICECSCTYGDTFTNKGESFKFVMFRGITLTEYLSISIIGMSEDPILNEVWSKINEILKLELLSIDYDEFDNLREFYAIRGVKSS